MDVFDEDILNFWRCLQDNNVRYILVGGFAVNLHGYHRFTGDIDIWLKDTLKNRDNLYIAFKDCQMGDFPIIKSKLPK